MSMQINQELQSVGIAKIIVILKKSVTTIDGQAVKSAMEKYFATSELSQSSALAANVVVKEVKVPTMRYYPHLGIIFGTVTREGLAALRNETDLVAEITGAPSISLIRPTKSGATSDLTQDVTWGIQALGIPEIWNAGYTGQGVLIGHLDTGADGNHPALQQAIRDFAEFDLQGRPRPGLVTAHDTDDHGTHTAATIAGRPVQGRAVGVAPGAELASAVVIEGGDVIARVLGGMDWVVGKGVRILNMSLGFRGWWRDFLPLATLLRNRNILPVFAVGNEGPGTSRSPGNYWQALSVGAIDQNLEVAEFSSSQKFKRKKDAIVPDVVAPGKDIISARPGGGYQIMDGTSMATPHISGLAALLWQARPNATVDLIEQSIFKSCQLNAGIKKERGNRGIPNGPRALKLLLNS